MYMVHTMPEVYPVPIPATVCTRLAQEGTVQGDFYDVDHVGSGSVDRVVFVPPSITGTEHNGIYRVLSMLAAYRVPSMLAAYRKY